VSGYPKGFGAFLYAVCAVLAASGLLLTPTVLDLRLEWDVPWRLSGGQRMGVAAAHTLAALVVTGVIGALWAVHVRRNWRQRRNRVTGAMLVGAWVFLALTGVAEMYLGDESAGLWASVTHTGVGALVVVLLAAHIVIGLRSRRIATAAADG